MENDFEVAPDFKRSDWLAFEKVLKANMKDQANWENAYNLLNSRIEARYMEPIEKIMQLNEKSFSGEGFAIMTILCSLIEFLEALYQGINYEHKKPDKNKFEYNDSGKKFQNFLISHEPFKNIFTEKLAEDFYINVRCGLLHEANTCKNWLIRIDSSYLIEEIDGDIIVNRDLFLKALRAYFENYKDELLASKDRKEAFIRKFNHLAQI